jgi:hypothetical protein
MGQFGRGVVPVFGIFGIGILELMIVAVFGAVFLGGIAGVIILIVFVVKHANSAPPSAMTSVKDDKEGP